MCCSWPVCLINAHGHVIRLLLFASLRHNYDKRLAAPLWTETNAPIPDGDTSAYLTAGFSLSIRAAMASGDVTKPTADQHRARYERQLVKAIATIGGLERASATF